MVDYIEREAAYREICADETMDGYEKAWCVELIRNAPAADVAPVQHGRRIKHDDGVFTCSECGNVESNESYFCRYCGAKMDGGAD